MEEERKRDRGKMLSMHNPSCLGFCFAKEGQVPDKSKNVNKHDACSGLEMSKE